MGGALDLGLGFRFAPSGLGLGLGSVGLSSRGQPVSVHVDAQPTDSLSSEDSLFTFSSQLTYLCGDALPVHVDGIEEGEDLIERGVLEHDHVLGKSVGKCEEGSLRVEPSVRAELSQVASQW